LTIISASTGSDIWLGELLQDSQSKKSYAKAGRMVKGKAANVHMETMEANTDKNSRTA